jgi:serine protease Do
VIPQPSGQPAPVRSSRPRWPVVVAIVAIAAILGSAAGATAWYLGRPAPIAVPTPIATTAASPSGSPTASPTPTGYTDFAAAFVAVSSGVAEVDAVTCDGKSSGTGFLVGRDRLMTAAHVINGAGALTVKTEHGSVKATVEGVDKTVDLAILKLARPVSGHVFAIADRATSTGARVATIGYRVGGHKSLADGEVSGSGREIRTESGTLTDMVKTDITINPGNSGGPVLDLAGHVIGLADAVRGYSDDVGYAVPASALAARLAGAKPWTEVEPTDCGTGNLDPALPGRAGADVAVAAVVRYLLVVNTGDWDAARAAVTPAFAKRVLRNESYWVKVYSTTYDDDFGLVDASADGTRADVRLTFRSQQDPGFGPTGAVNVTCLRWELVYHLRYVDGGWLIDSADTVGDPGWKRC